MVKLKSIFEELINDELLGEDFDSQKGLEKIVDNFLVKVVEEQIYPLEDWCKRNMDENKPIDYDYKFRVFNFTELEGDFGDLNNFVRKLRHLDIIIQKIGYNIVKGVNNKDLRVADSSRGSYTPSEIPNKGFPINRERRIVLRYSEKFFTHILSGYKKNKEIVPSNILYAFKHEFESILLHELQHVYDDFRSGGEIFKTKQTKDYFNRLENQLYKDTDLYLDSIEYQYRNLEHEVWARFTQAIKDINMVDELEYNIKDLQDVIRDFKYNMVGFKDLNEKTQRRLIKALMGFWYRENEILEDRLNSIVS